MKYENVGQYLILTSKVSAPPTMLRPKPDLPFCISILVSRPGIIEHVAGLVSMGVSGSCMTGAAGGGGSEKIKKIHKINM